MSDHPWAAPRKRDWSCLVDALTVRLGDEICSGKALSWWQCLTSGQTAHGCHFTSSLRLQ